MANVQINVRIPEELIDEVERIAKLRKMNNSQVYRMLLDLGADCHKDLEKLGIIGVIDLSYYVREAIKKMGKGNQLNLPI